MLGTTSSFATDPNTLRAIEQLAIVVNDVETRLNLVKLALAQSVHVSSPFHPTNAITPLTPTVGLPVGVNPLALLQALTSPSFAPALSASLNPYAMANFGVNPGLYTPSIATPTISPYGSVTTPFAHAGLGLATPSFRL